MIRSLIALAALLAALAPPAEAGTGRWSAARVGGRPAAEAVTLVGRAGVSATRVAVYCTPGGRLAVSFARRPGMPARAPLTLVLETDAGVETLSGRTNLYGVLALEGAAARAAARLLAAARHRAAARLADSPYGAITVVGSTKAIGRVLDACGR
jgi:hypothetical protein